MRLAILAALAALGAASPAFGQWPNILGDPGFEEPPGDGGAGYWRGERGGGMRAVLEDARFATPVPVPNADFEERDEDGFIKGMTIRKVGGSKYITFKRTRITREQANALRTKTKPGEMQVTADDAVAHGGRRSLKFHIENCRRDREWAEVFFPLGLLEAGAEHRVTFWYRTALDAQIDVLPFVVVPGVGYRQVLAAAAPTGGEWRRAGFAFRCRSAKQPAALQFWATCDGKGKGGAAWFDDVALQRRDEPWASRCWGPVSPGRSGLRALAATGTPEGFAVAGEPDLPIDSSKRYRLRAWVKGQGATGVNSLQIVWLRQWVGNFWPGAVTGVARSAPLTGTFDWREVEVAAAPPPHTNAARVRILSAANAGTLMVDDLHFDGFGDEEVEFLYSQAGFEPRGRKDVVVRTKRELEGRAEMLVFPVETGEAVLRRPLAHRGACRYGRHYYGADFSDLTEPGEYRIQVRFGERLWRETAAFPIRAGRYRELTRFASRWYRLQRCGCEVEGWRPACHLDDAWLTNWGMTENVRHVDLTGGWHDAGDMNKWVGGQGETVWALVRVHRCTGDNDASFLGTALPDLLAEAEWGATYLAKAYAGQGKWYACCKPTVDFRVPTADETDNVPGTWDDRCSNAVAARPMATLGLAAYAAAMAGRDAPSAQPALAKAREAFEADVAAFGDAQTKHGDYPAALYGEYPTVALAACELHRATGRPEYRETARGMVAEIASRVLARDYLERPPPSGGLRFKVQYGHMTYHYATAMEEFLSLWPDDVIAPRVRAALGRFLDDVAAFSARLPLAVTRPVTNETDEDVYSPARHCPHVMAAAMHLAVGARLLGRPELLGIAERDLQYAWGRNFAGVSQMACVGRRWASQYTGMMTNPGREDGVMPGAVNKGHGFRLRGRLFPYATLPMPYERGIADAHQEVWLLCQNLFLAACAETAKSLETLTGAD